MIDLTDKLFHIKVLDVEVVDHGDLGSDTTLEAIFLDGPLAGGCIDIVLCPDSELMYRIEDE